MSTNDENPTNFNFSYTVLKQLADKTLTLINRDIAEFTDRGFDSATQKEYQSCLTAFSECATDEEIEAIKIAATDAKDEAGALVEKQMRTIFLAARNVFGESSGPYKEFGNSDLSRQSDPELLRNASKMVEVATRYSICLLTEGITIAKINALERAGIAFDNAIDLEFQALHNRDNGTKMRTRLANNLYALLVNYNDTGKDIWIEENESKYKDYMTYNTQTGVPEVLGQPLPA